MPPPKCNPQDFRDRADNCDELAARATIPEVCTVMRYVASVWRELADADEAEQRRLGVALARRRHDHEDDAGQDIPPCGDACD